MPFQSHENPSSNYNEYTPTNEDGAEQETLQNLRMLAKNMLVDTVKKSQESPSWGVRKIQDIWNKLPDTDQQKLYHNGRANLSTILGKNPFMFPINVVQGIFDYESKMAKLVGPHYDNMFRSYVQLGLLEPPSNITPEQILEDILRDQGGIEKSLTFLAISASAIAPEAALKIAEFKSILSNISDFGTEVRIEASPYYEDEIPRAA